MSGGHGPIRSEYMDVADVVPGDLPVDGQMKEADRLGVPISGDPVRIQVERGFLGEKPQEAFGVDGADAGVGAEARLRAVPAGLEPQPGKMSPGPALDLDHFASGQNANAALADPVFEGLGQGAASSLKSVGRTKIGADPKKMSDQRDLPDRRAQEHLGIDVEEFDERLVGLPFFEEYIRGGVDHGRLDLEEILLQVEKTEFLEDILHQLEIIGQGALIMREGLIEAGLDALQAHGHEDILPTEAPEAIKARLIDAHRLESAAETEPVKTLMEGAPGVVPSEIMKPVIDIEPLAGIIAKKRGHLVAALDKGHVQTGLGQKKGRGQAAESRSDDHRVLHRSSVNPLIFERCPSATRGP